MSRHKVFWQQKLTFQVSFEKYVNVWIFVKTNVVKAVVTFDDLMAISKIEKFNSWNKAVFVGSFIL